MIAAVTNNGVWISTVALVFTVGSSAVLGLAVKISDRRRAR